MMQPLVYCTVSETPSSPSPPIGPEKWLLEVYKTHIFKVVAVDRIYHELCEKKVIDETMERCIFESRSDDDKRGHLFYHMRDYGTLDTFKAFCDVITSEEYNGIHS